ncbi:hypothetical protein Y032_0246g28 [Ancylostoma ceylanicum]|uniref:Uncharacterized protein n=1 Tax=Ancylostoma ceylanicum TaxID=53326 RepID=A0A016SCQ5_9BILA|nr:hypothetical protein Y032_0246g28 [Ancylostoma ceylanicum]
MENVVRILRDNDKENEDVVAALLPVVIRETFPLEQGFGKLYTCNIFISKDISKGQLKVFLHSLFTVPTILL